MNWKYVHKVWALYWCPRKLSMGAQTLCTAFFLLAAMANPARAACPAAPIGDAEDMAISFLAANGVQAASASMLSASNKEGTLVYDDTSDTLKVCDGDNWIEVGSGGGTDTLATLTCDPGEVPEWDGSDWICGTGSGGGSSLEYFAGRTLLVGNINYSGVTPTNHYPVTVPADTKAVKLEVYYHHGHNGSTHGYLSFIAYQKGQTDNAKKVTYTSQHFSDYANSDVAFMDIPWDDSLEDEVTIQVTTSHNTDASNRYHIYHAGHVVGGGGGGGGTDTLATLSCDPGEVPEWDGSDWICGTGSGGGGGTSVAFSVHKNGVDQTVTANVAVKLTWATEVFDTNNNFDTTTGRFTPTVAGKYLINLAAYCKHGGASTGCTARIYKNGAEVAAGHLQVNGGGSVDAIPLASTILDMNGTTDYVEAFVTNYNSTSIEGEPAYTRFYGVRLGGGGSDTLTTLSCDPGEVPEWDGSAWICGTGLGGGGSVDFGAYQTISQFGVDITAPTAGIVMHGATQSGGNYCHVQIFVNGVNVGTDKGYNTGSIAQSVTAPVAAGDTYRLSSDADCTDVKAFFVPLTGGGGAASSMVPGWPDAILCSGTGGTSLFNLAWVTTAGAARYTMAGDYGSTTNSPRLSYASPSSTPTVDETATWPNFATSCSGKTIAQLYADGQAFDFAGGGGSGGSDTLSTLSCDPGEVPEWDGSAWICGEGVSGGGSFMSKTLSATWTVVNGAVVPFNTVISSHGTNITAAGNQITVKAGSSYMLIADLRAGSMANEAFDYRFYDVTAGAFVGSHGSEADGANLESNAYALVRPSVDTTYELRVIGLAGSVTALTAYSTITAVELGGGGGGGSAEAAGDEGQVQFNDGADALAADAALHWDNTNKRLGIGTALPSGPLTLLTSGTNGGEADDLSVRSYSSASANGAPAVSLLRGRGTVGSPEAILTGDALGNLWFGGHNGSALGNYSANIGAVAEDDFDTSRATALTFSTHNGTSVGERLRLTADGNVGIGTTAPATKLDVIGTAASDTLRLRGVPGDPPTGGSGLWTTDGTHVWRATGNVGIGTATPVGPGSAGARLKVVRTSGHWGLVVEGSGTMQSDILLHTPNNTADMRTVQFVNVADKFTIRSLTDAPVVSQNLFVADLANGNVGIGTTTPNRELEVAGRLFLSGNGTTLSRLTLASSIASPASNLVWNIDASGGAMRFFHEPDIDTAGTVRMTILANGNVGIGTSSPVSKLHVVGSDWVSSAITQRRGAFDWNHLVSASGAYILRYGDITVANDHFTVLDSGNVGIGTTSPDYTLDVRGGAHSSNQNFGIQIGVPTGQWKGGLKIKSDGSGVKRLALDYPLGNDGTTGEGIAINANGSVGIGTTNPATKLDVWGGHIRIGGHINPRLYLNSSSASVSPRVIDVSGTDWRFYREGAPEGTLIQMTLSASGYLTTAGGGVWSDLRLKKDVEPLPDSRGLQSLLALRPVVYKWRDEERGTNQNIGLIAQEVEAVIPEVVRTSETGEHIKSVDYSALTVPLIRAVQELKAENDHLRNELKARDDALQARIDELEAKLK